MARNDKQLSYEERYKEKMERYKEAYKIRTDFASKFKLDTKKAKGLSTETIVNNASGGSGNGSAEKPSDAGDGVTISGGTEMQKKICAEAIKWVGKVTYVFGATDVEGGRSDCSGYTSYVYNKVTGKGIGRTTTQQNKAGKIIEPRDKAQPGDLIMFQGTYRAGVSHVGIVLDWPKIVHCGSSKGVAYAEVKDGNYYDKHFLSIRRILSDSDSSSDSKNDADAKALSFRPYADDTTSTSIEDDRPDEDGMESLLLQGQQPTTTPGAPEDSIVPPLHWYSVADTYNPVQINIPAQYIRIPVNVNRANFFHQRIMWANKTGYAYFDKLDPDHFVHITRHDGLEGNLYSPDAAKAFEILRLKSKREKIEILSGFRFSPEGLISPHEAGCAIDIRVYGEEDARKLADIAWACGFRSIAIGGDIVNGGGFIHLDIGPKSEWSYDNIPAYQGPGRWTLSETK